MVLDGFDIALMLLDLILRIGMGAVGNRGVAAGEPAAYMAGNMAAVVIGRNPFAITVQ